MATTNKSNTHPSTRNLLQGRLIKVSLDHPSTSYRIHSKSPWAPSRTAEVTHIYGRLLIPIDRFQEDPIKRKTKKKTQKVTSSSVAAKIQKKARDIQAEGLGRI